MAQAYRHEGNRVGLSTSKGCPNCNRMQMRNTEVTNAGLEHLKGLANLGWLNVAGTKVTHAGLKHLKGLTQFGEPGGGLVLSTPT